MNFTLHTLTEQTSLRLLFKQILMITDTHVVCYLTCFWRLISTWSVSHDAAVTRLEQLMSLEAGPTCQVGVPPKHRVKNNLQTDVTEHWKKKYEELVVLFFIWRPYLEQLAPKNTRQIVAVRITSEFVLCENVCVTVSWLQEAKTDTIPMFSCQHMK